MNSGLFAKIEDEFVATVALVVKTTDEWPKPGYRLGWWSGYAKAWEQVTGHSQYELIRRVNKALAGSGKELRID